MLIRTRTSGILVSVNVLPATTFQGIGDIFPGANAWWGLRAYSAASIGSNAVQLQYNDATQINYATIAGGGLPLSTISADTTTHGSPVKVRTLYDQSGNGLDLVQTTFANMPVFNISGFGSLPSMDFTAANSTKISAANVTIASLPIIMIYVGKHTTSGVQQVMTGSAGGAGAITYRASANNQITYFGGTANAPIVTATDDTQHSAIINHLTPSANTFITLDGVDSATGDPGSSTLVNTFNFGADGGGGQFVDGSAEELGLWNTAPNGTQRTNIYNNHHSYYGV